MQYCGLTSITFRNLNWLENICVACECGLQGIEWGGDIHVPPGDIALAGEVAQATREAGLAVLSYGSYYRLGAGQDFAPVLASAVALNAPIIRVWAGTKASAKYTTEERELAVADATRIAAQAAAHGITVALEYHRDTLTDNATSAVDFLQAAGNIKTYWQPNPELTRSQNLQELQAVLPWLTYVHVFQWRHDGTRLPLQEGTDDWAAYFAAAGKHAGAAILEFVKDNSPAQCAQDAMTLKQIAK
ncbi:MAG: TIM barrel protein [Oscillospiraceae bacterium]|nr:TIM barrel protein [Oscillospiraceae bacterium]